MLKLRFPLKNTGTHRLGSDSRLRGNDESWRNPPYLCCPRNPQTPSMKTKPPKRRLRSEILFRPFPTDILGH
ncbi:hypothetical protein [Neisseria sp.]|uniref:hypothetical protein n=1 Tax=Neisseria sp. TaxID=192066 RepID=UPI00359FF1B1